MDEQQSRPRAGLQIAHFGIVSVPAQRNFVFFNGQAAWRFDSRFQCALRSYLLLRDNFLSAASFYIRVSPLSLIEGEFRLSLIFSPCFQSIAIESHFSTSLSPRAQ